MRVVGFSCIAAVTASYSETRAIDFAKLAGASYCDQDSLPSWACGDFCNDMAVTKVQVCQGRSTISYVGEWEGKGLVSVRGTHGFKALLADLELVQSGVDFAGCDGCKTHSGFLDEWNSMESCVKSSLKHIGHGPGSYIRTTGHSLGASINELAMIALDQAGWHIDESYHFGTPRTGNTPFAQYWNSKFSGLSYRVTHHRDPVPQVPLDNFLILNFHYEHVVPEIFYKGHLSAGWEKCTSVHQHSECVEQYWNIAIDALNLDDHLHYMDLDIAGCPGGPAASDAPTADGPPAAVAV